MKKDIGFRFDEETHERLRALAQEWGCTRTQVIERLLFSQDAALYRGPALSDILPKPKPDPPHPGPGVVDPEIHAMVVEADKTIPEFPPSKPLSRAEREELTDAAQRRMAQSQKGKKK